MKNDATQTTVGREEVPVLHIHGQLSWHNAVTIVGNGWALAALRELLNAALAKGQSAGEFTVADGEGYQLAITLQPASFGDRAWDRCRLPYADPIANLPDADGITPAMIEAAERVWHDGVRNKIGVGMLAAIYRAMRVAEGLPMGEDLDMTGKPKSDDAMEILARSLHARMEHLDPTGNFEWEDLRDCDREIYRVSVKGILSERRVVMAALGLTTCSWAE